MFVYGGHYTFGREAKTIPLHQGASFSCMPHWSLYNVLPTDKSRKKRKKKRRKKNTYKKQPFSQSAMMINACGMGPHGRCPLHFTSSFNHFNATASGHYVGTSSHFSNRYFHIGAAPTLSSLISPSFDTWALESPPVINVKP